MWPKMAPAGTGLPDSAHHARRRWRHLGFRVRLLRGVRVTARVGRGTRAISSSSGRCLTRHPLGEVSTGAGLLPGGSVPWGLGLLL